VAKPAKKTPYTEIATRYRQLIEDGTLRPGDPMPSMREVQEKLESSMATVNRAYRLLKDEGLIYTQPGARTVVAERPRVVSTGAARLRRYSRTGKYLGPGETTSNHEVALRSCADPEIADALGIELHDEVGLRRRVHRQDGKPRSVGLSVIHPRAWGPVPEVLQEGPSERFWQEHYTERTGKEITRSPERRTARLATSIELELLEIVPPPHAAVPVLTLINVFHDEDGPIEYWEDVYAPGLWQVEGEPS